MLLIPEVREAATTSKPEFRSFATTFDPISPLPPITMIFTTPSFDWAAGLVKNLHSELAGARFNASPGAITG
jgi:hypothetical protein